MYIEGSAAAWVLFLLGFLSCGMLSLAAWNVFNALSAKEVMRLLEEYLEEKDGA